MISIKSPAELALIAQAGRIVSLIIKGLGARVEAGISTYELDKVAASLFEKYGAVSAFKGYRGFPGNICTSVNAELIHGIPSKKKILRPGDILSLDIGVNSQGFFADAAVTLPVGRISKQAQDLLKVTREALYQGIAQARTQARLSDISATIQARVEAGGYSVVREFVGHGIGTQMHEEPEIPNYGSPGHGPILKQGMVLAIEPMVNAGGPGVRIMPDGWTVVTQDGSLSAHFEHTVCINQEGPRILTE
jgi:methionyl aminopeptidase